MRQTKAFLKHELCFTELVLLFLKAGFYMKPICLYCLAVLNFMLCLLQYLKINYFKVLML